VRISFTLFFFHFPFTYRYSDRYIFESYFLQRIAVGLASHWPCVTDSVVYPFTWPTGSTTVERHMSSAPSLRLSLGMAPHTLLCRAVHMPILLA